MAAKPRRVIEGGYLPRAPVSLYGSSRIEPVNLSDLLGVGRHIVIGLPAETTTLFDGQELSNLLEMSGPLKRSGLKSINCVVFARPHAVHTWRRTVDPEERARFFADPRLSFAAALDLVLECPEEEPARHPLGYMLIVEAGVIKRARVERVEEPEEEEAILPEVDLDLPDESVLAV